MCSSVKLIRESLGRSWGFEWDVEVIREELGRVRTGGRKQFQAGSVALVKRARSWLTLWLVSKGLENN